MKLKLVVASMSVLGLISCPVLADTQTKHKHHHHHHHHAMMAHTVAKGDYKGDYKDMGVMPVAEVCPKVDIFDSMLDAMSQNLGRAKPTVHCMDPLSFAGGITFQSNWGNLHSGYTTENPRRLSLNDAYLNLYGNVNDWTQAFASLSYSNFISTGDPTVLAGRYSNSYTNNAIQLEQGYITFKNQQVTPLFARVGKMFTDFGRYQLHPMVRTLAQSLTESLHTTAQVGFLTQMGFEGSVYSFNNTMRNGANGHRVPNYGAEIGFMQPSDQLGWDIGLGWMYDYTGTDDIAAAVGTFNGTGFNGATTSTRVGGAEVHGDVNSGPFTLGVRYASALRHFNIADLGNKATLATSTKGAQPWAADITGGYGFSAWGRDQNIYLGYQASGDAINVFLPKNRWIAGYGVNVWKSTNLNLQVNHDTAYSKGAGGTGNSSNTVNLGVGVKFG